MSIFKHSGTAVKEPSSAPSPQTAAPEGQSDQPGRLTPPFAPQAAPQRGAAPGVVPPPAAPVYSMRPPESVQRVDPAAANSSSESVNRAKVQHAATRVVQRPAAAPTPQPSSTAPTRPCFDRVAATQAGLLKLAWKWQEAGAPIRAIHTYIELLTRYPNTPGADAAVADLVELSDILTEQGQFHTALAIYDHLEALLA